MNYCKFCSGDQKLWGALRTAVFSGAIGACVLIDTLVCEERGTAMILVEMLDATLQNLVPRGSCTHVLCPFLFIYLHLISADVFYKR